MDTSQSRLRTADPPPAHVLAARLHLPNATSAVQGMLDRALVYCAEQMDLDGPEAALAALRWGDRVARWYCHHSLGKQAAEVLGDLNHTVKQVLVFDLEAPPEDLLFGEPGPTLPIHLVVEAERRTEALCELVDALQHALLREYTHVVGGRQDQPLLEIQVIDADDIEKRRGYVGLLGSLLNCPVQIWQR